MAAHEPTPVVDEGAAPPAGLKAKLPLIALVAVGLAVGGGTGASFLGPIVAKKMGRSAPAHSESGAADSLGEHAASGAKGGEKAGEKAAGKEGEKAGEKGKDSSAPSIHLLENLVLNPAASGGGRFLLFTVAIETGTPTASTDFKDRDAELRDIILTALGTKTVDQLVDMSAREAIKTEIQAVICARFGKNSVKRLYFPQFVVQ